MKKPDFLPTFFSTAERSGILILVSGKAVRGDEERVLTTRSSCYRRQ